jgi:hypothetical protein
MVNLPVVNSEVKLPLQSIFRADVRILSPEFSFSPRLYFLFGSGAPDIRESIKLFDKIGIDGTSLVDCAEQHFDYYMRGTNRERLVNRFRFLRRDEIRHYSDTVYHRKTENFTVESLNGQPIWLFNFSKLFANGCLVSEQTDIYQFEIQHHYSFY